MTLRTLDMLDVGPLFFLGKRQQWAGHFCPNCCAVYRIYAFDIETRAQGRWTSLLRRSGGDFDEENVMENVVVVVVGVIVSRVNGLFKESNQFVDDALARKIVTSSSVHCPSDVARCAVAEEVLRLHNEKERESERVEQASGSEIARGSRVCEQASNLFYSPLSFSLTLCSPFPNVSIYM